MMELKIEASALEVQFWRRVQVSLKANAWSKIQAFVKSLLVYFPSPKFNIRWGINDRIDDENPDKDINYNKGFDHFDCVLFNLQFADPFGTNQVIVLQGKGLKPSAILFV